MREILFKDGSVDLFEALVRKSFRFLYRYRYSLHKTAVWSDVSPWSSFAETRLLSLCMENTKVKQMALVVCSEMDWVSRAQQMQQCL